MGYHRTEEGIDVEKIMYLLDESQARSNGTSLDCFGSLRLDACCENWHRVFQGKEPIYAY